jgi:hypothetical protein
VLVVVCLHEMPRGQNVCGLNFTRTKRGGQIVTKRKCRGQIVSRTKWSVKLRLRHRSFKVD